MRRTILLLALIGVPLVACSGVNTAREQVSTVNQAVEVLQAVDSRSAWEQVLSALDDLASAQIAYRASAALHTRPVSATAAPPTELIWHWQVDGEGDQQLTITQADERHEYLLPATSDQAFELRTDGSFCLVDEATAATLRTGLHELLALSGFEEAAMRALVVLDGSQETTIGGRTATRYVLKSRLPEALDILNSYNDSNTAQVQAAAQEIRFSGSVSLDRKTGALLGLQVTIEDAGQGTRTDLSFELTQWGTAPDIPGPESTTPLPCQ